MQFISRGLLPPRFQIAAFNTLGSFCFLHCRSQLPSGRDCSSPVISVFSPLAARLSPYPQLRSPISSSLLFTSLAFYYVSLVLALLNLIPNLVWAPPIGIFAPTVSFTIFLCVHPASPVHRTHFHPFEGPNFTSLIHCKSLFAILLSLRASSPFKLRWRPRLFAPELCQQPLSFASVFAALPYIRSPRIDFSLA